MGFELTYERTDDKRASRVAAYRELNLDAGDRAHAVTWAAAGFVAISRHAERPAALPFPGAEDRRGASTPP